MSNPILIDIGSMDGREIKWGLDHGYEVHAFEPNPNCKKDLEQYEGQAFVNYAAAWDEDGEVVLHLMATNEPGEDGVSLIKEKTNVSSDKILIVPSINIGQYIKELGRPVDILKINTEGAEYTIIESILNTFPEPPINRWLVEDHAHYINSDKWTQKKNEIINRLEEMDITLEEYHGL